MESTSPFKKTGLSPTVRIGKDAKPVLVFVLSLLMIPVFFALSTGPAYFFSEHTEDAKIVFYFPKGQPVWVSPWLYYFSNVMHYLTYTAMIVAVLGALRINWRRERVA